VRVHIPEAGNEELALAVHPPARLPRSVPVTLAIVVPRIVTVQFFWKDPSVDETSTTLTW